LLTTLTLRACLQHSASAGWTHGNSDDVHTDASVHHSTPRSVWMALCASLWCQWLTGKRSYGRICCAVHKNCCSEGDGTVSIMMMMMMWLILMFKKESRTAMSAASSNRVTLSQHMVERLQKSCVPITDDSYKYSYEKTPDGYGMALVVIYS